MITKTIFDSISWIYCQIPREYALKTSFIYTFLFKIFCLKRSKVCSKNIELVLGRSFQSKQSKALINQMYKHIGYTIIDFLRIPLYKKKYPEHFIDIDTEEKLLKPFERKKGLIMIMAHVGHWELMSVICNHHHIKGGPVVKDIRNKDIDQFVNGMRETENIKPIKKKQSVREIISRLKNNELIGFVLDQNMNLDNGVYVPFGNSDACTLSAPALLSIRYQVPVVSAFLVREKDHRYRLIVSDEIKFDPTGHLKDDVKKLTATYNQKILEIIKQYPEQWIWMHKRFKNQQDGSNPYHD